MSKQHHKLVQGCLHCPTSSTQNLIWLAQGGVGIEIPDHYPYHLHCIGLEQQPRKWICNACKASGLGEAMICVPDYVVWVCNFQCLRSTIETPPEGISILIGADDPVLKEALQKYHCKGKTNNTEILERLLAEYNITLRSVKRRRRDLNLYGSKVTTHKMPHQEKVQLIIDKLNKDISGSQSLANIKTGATMLSCSSNMGKSQDYTILLIQITMNSASGSGQSYSNKN
ncbi:hypothetical protein BYT27DRAFT_7212877 [Phlegmacium glaucopus]|nr:hypothetical protein BYT27DRAFT_7212877 [Phlegmacium glaucopus]